MKSEKFIISGYYNKRTIIIILKYNGDEYTYEKIFFGIDKLNQAVHSILAYDDQLYIVDSFNGIVYKYNLNKKDLSKVTVGKDPRHIARLDKKLYVTNFESDSVSVIDIDKFYLIESVPAGIKPHDITIEQNNKKIYVASYEENLIIEFENNTKKKAFYKTDGKPIHIDKYKNRLFVLTYFLNGNVISKLNVIDIHNKSIEIPCAIKGLVTNIKYDPYFNAVYMINIEDRYLYCADLKNNETKKLLFLGGYPEDIVIGNKNIFITNSKKKSLVIIDKQSKQKEKTIHLGFSPECIISI